MSNVFARWSICSLCRGNSLQQFNKQTNYEKNSKRIQLPAEFEILAKLSTFFFSFYFFFPAAMYSSIIQSGAGGWNCKSSLQRYFSHFFKFYVSKGGGGGGGKEVKFRIIRRQSHTFLRRLEWVFRTSSRRTDKAVGRAGWNTCGLWAGSRTGRRSGGSWIIEDPTLLSILFGFWILKNNNNY